MISRTRATVSSVWEVEGLSVQGSSSKDRRLLATHTVVDVHPRTSTERMKGDTDLRFCTYTCTDLPRVPLCCHFATYYKLPEKKSDPELNDQPTYFRIWLVKFEVEDAVCVP
jgi:hypothetical protein